jgi:hypothetical protein
MREVMAPRQACTLQAYIASYVSIIQLEWHACARWRTFMQANQPPDAPSLKRW